MIRLAFLLAFLSQGEPRVRDASSYGVGPAATEAANRAGIQQSIDALKATGGGTARLPGGKLLVDRPVWLRANNAMLAGRGRSATSIEYGPFQSGPLLIAGFNPPPLDWAAHALDLAGMVDATAGKRYGFRSNGDSSLLCSGSLFSFGPSPGGWPSSSAITVEFGFCGPLPAGFVLGASARRQARPFYLHVHPSGYMGVWVGADTGLVGVERTYGRTWPTPAALGPGRHTLVIQADLAAGADWLRVWVDGQPQAATSRDDPPPGLRLARNRETPWRVGAAGESGSVATDGSLPGAGIGDWSTCGLRVGSVPRYRAGGDALARLDGKPINDINTLFYPEPGIVSLLPMLDPPGPDSPLADRLVQSGRPGDLACWCLVMPAAMDLSVGVKDTSVRDLTVVAARPGAVAGEALWLGTALGFSARDCSFLGGGYGVGGGNVGLAYKARLDGCTFAGAAAPLNLYYSMVDVTGGTIPTLGRGGIVARRSKVRVGGLFVSFASPATESLVESYGSQTVLDGCDWDLEDGAARPAFPIVADSSAAVESSGLNSGALTIRDCSFGRLRDGVPVVRLIGGGAKVPAVFSWERLPGLAGTFPSLVNCPGDWTGSLTGLGAIPWTPVAGAGAGAFKVDGVPVPAAIPAVPAFPTEVKP